MLYNIIAVLILRENVNLRQNLIFNRSSFSLRAFLENSLDHSAAVSMNTKFKNIFCHEIYDEVQFFMWKSFNALLDNMVSILIKYTILDHFSQFRSQKFLLIQSYKL